jgi:hypothetical protein
MAPGAGAGAAGVCFWQAAAMVDAASARMARPGLIMVVVLTGAWRPVKRPFRLWWVDRGTAGQDLQAADGGAGRFSLPDHK